LVESSKDLLSFLWLEATEDPNLMDRVFLFKVRSVDFV